MPIEIRITALIGVLFLGWLLYWPYKSRRP